MEIAEIDVLSSHETAFEEAVEEAAPLFRTAKGCRSFALDRSVDQPGRYRLMVGWDSVHDHVVNFRESPNFAAWRALVAPHFSAPPKVDHVERLFDGF
ncbi:MAG: antibiotic biosynthesis monooxygenase [Pseudomonadota bacterium]